jgi:predicted kinase
MHIVCMKKQKIILTRGLPASGKSTWSMDQVAKSNGKTKRVNKDLLRDMIDAGIWSKTNEQQILAARDALVGTWLANGVETIIVDDTNFEDKHLEAMKTIAQAYMNKNAQVYMNTPADYYTNTTVEYKDFLDVSLDECIERDSKRIKPVGQKVIRDMHQRYILPTIKDAPAVNKKGNAIIVDLDGTYCHKCDRNWFEYSKVDQDALDVTVDGIVRAYANMGYTILIVSGREGTQECRSKTLSWLDKHKVPYYDLMMRNEKDFRRDSIVKKEIYERFIKDKFDVEFVLDDRNSVCIMWREIGLKCLQVAEGNF